MPNSELSPYEAIPSPVKCARWIAFIRLFCYARTPACIYSKMVTPYSHRVFRTTSVIPAPDYISNLLCELIDQRRVREAAIQTDEESLSELKSISSTFKPRGMEPYGITKSAVVRLGASLVGDLASAVGNEEQVRRALVEAVTRLGSGLEQPAPLWWDELEWLEANGGRWLWSVVLPGVMGEI